MNEENRTKIYELRAALRGLSVYRKVNELPVMIRVNALLDSLYNGNGEQALVEYSALFDELCASGTFGLGKWLREQLCYMETSYASIVEKGEVNQVLLGAARSDVETLSILANTNCDCYIEAMKEILPSEYGAVLARLPKWNASVPFSFDELTGVYRQEGTGLYARYRAFLWEEGRLIPVPEPDCPKPEDLLGYELQRDQVETNTRQLVEGRPSNNVLLFGDGGTGKSATVKSMLNLAGMEELRLIEIQKENITGLPSLIRSLAGRRQKFILFVDDLAFDQDDKAYSSMKTILEGFLEKRPVNVAIYATSNRRHLVRQTFTDRVGDDVDAFETISEKTALAERFGLRIPYLTMNKADYLTLVEYLAKQAGIEIPLEELHSQAMAWEIRHAGRTPRVARQFIASLHK